MPPPPLELPADLVEQIFLRLPPDEPRCLFLASLVSKPWLRRLAGPSFRRRYSEHHRTLPMLGFLTCDSVGDSGNHNSRYVPTVKLCPPGPGRRYLRPLDARHGRVLFLTDPADEDCDFPELIVWDPITLEEWVIEMPDHSFGSWAAVLCAKEGCDHLDCHGHPFLGPTCPSDTMSLGALPSITHRRLVPGVTRPMLTTMIRTWLIAALFMVLHPTSFWEAHSISTVFPPR